jgi:photosynthetic reaction center H subunit
MIRGAITNNIDVAQVVLYAFFIFFAGLIFYLRREDRREGYPLEDEATGRFGDRGFLLIPDPKTFLRAHGEPVLAPDFVADTRELNAEKVAPWPGAPRVPVGDPLLAGVGPGSYALRADVPEKTHDGRNLIAPLRVATNFFVPSEDGDPIGLPVVGADGEAAGVVKDLWVDRAESFVRFYEVDIGGRSILLPIGFASLNFDRTKITVEAILGEQFARTPTTRDADSVTLLEEEKIMAFYGAGTLYATPARAEPLL